MRFALATPRISEGRTLEQIQAARPTADYDERTGNPQSANAFIQQLYEELMAAGRFFGRHD